MKNPFEKPKKEEETLSEQVRKNAKAALNETIALAKKCLQSEDFKKYAEAYKKLEEQTVNDLLEVKVINPTEYAMAISNVTSELRILRLLLEGVERDARRK